MLFNRYNNYIFIVIVLCIPFAYGSELKHLEDQTFTNERISVLKQEITQLNNRLIKLHHETTIICHELCIVIKELKQTILVITISGICMLTYSIFKRCY